MTTATVRCAQPGCDGTIQDGYCGTCDQPVGRGRDGHPGLAEGFCRNCGARFSFRPKLEPGRVELVDMANAIRPRTLT